jgi:hypothetical protein
MLPATRPGGAGEEQVQLLPVRNFGTRWGWVVSFTPRPLSTPRYRWIGDWVDTTEATRGKESFTHVWDQTPAVQLVVRHYTGSATPAHEFLTK